MADKQTKMCEVFISASMDDGVGCGLEFTKAFMEMPDEFKKVIIYAMPDEFKKVIIYAMLETMRSYQEEAFEELGGRDVHLVDAEEVDQAAEDASNFLDRCVKEHGGRLH
jgi:hypothetical protein